MNTTMQHSPAFLKKRRFYVALPILIIPFITLLFWVLGGGSGNQVSAQPTQSIGGLNLQLPSAKLKDDSRLTKLDYYKKADEDSAKRLTQMKNDPYYRLPALKITHTDTAPSLLLQHGATPAKYTLPVDQSTYSMTSYHDPNEAKVYQKLAVLNAQLNKNANASTAMPKKTAMPSATSPDIDRLENIVHVLHSKDTTADPEMQQLNGMLDKLMALQQHAGPGVEKIKAPDVVPPKPTLTIALPDTDNITVLNNSRLPQASPDSLNPMPVIHNAFYSLDDDKVVDPAANTLEAMVPETQTLVNGATIRLRTLQDLVVKSRIIPKDQLLVGTVQLSGERLNIIITSIRCQNDVLPVSLAVYDLDGLAGVAIPGAITRDVAKQSADQSISSVGLTSLDQSIGAQAATAGIQTMKNLISKKVKLVKVTVPAGYRVLLKDNTQKAS